MMRLRIALACALGGIAATSVVAQPAGEPDSLSPAVAAARDITPPAPAPLPDGRIRFSFKDASFEQVIEFFSRTTGLPVVWETDPPDGTLSYLSPESYDRDEALRILNVVLQSRGVMLRVSDDMLYLQTLADMQREDLPTFVGTLPADVTDDQIVTVVLPLDLSLAGPIAEKLASMIGTYGSIAALEQQNAIVLTETAAQCRRLVGIIQELDREDPEGAIEIFKIEHARASLLMKPLQALLSTTVERIVLDKKNQPQRVKEQEMSGLAISFDDRTNSIIAKGVQSRIDKLREAVELLDVPSTSSDRALKSFELFTVTVADAVERLNALFATTDEKQRPVIIAHPDRLSVTVVGNEQQVEDAARVMAALEGTAPAPANDTEREMVVRSLRHVKAPNVITALTALLTPREAASITLVPGPDGNSLVVAGPADAIASLDRMLPALDRPQRVDRRVRIVTLTGNDAPAQLARAEALYAAQREPGDAEDLAVDLDPSTRRVTLVGPTSSLDRFIEAVRLTAEQERALRETRQIALQSAQPSAITESLARLAAQLLAPRDGGSFAAPEIEAVDDLDIVIVTADGDHFGVIESLVTALDRPRPDDFQFRVVPIAGIEDPDLLRRRADEAYARMSVGVEPTGEPALEIEHDAASGNLVVSGRTEDVARYERALAEVRRLMPPARAARVFTLDRATAADVATALGELAEAMRPVEPGRVMRAPEITVIERTNSLYVVAEPAQMSSIEWAVRELDASDGALPPVRLLDVRSADAARVADVLRRRYDTRPDAARRARPVLVDVDPTAGQLIVTAHEALLPEIETLVAELEDAAGATRGLRVLRVNVADPQALADRALTLLAAQVPSAPEPRVEIDGAGAALVVTADDDTLDRFARIVEQLQAAAGPAPDVRLVPLASADATEVAMTLRELAQQHTTLAGRAGAPAPTFEPVPRLNAVLVAAAPGQHAVIRSLVESLDTTQPDTLPPLRVLHLRTADAETLAAALVRRYDRRTLDARRTQPVTITADGANNALLVAAHPDLLPEIQSVVEALNAASWTDAGERELRVFPLQSARATALAASLTEMFPSAPRDGRSRTRRDAIERPEIVVRADAQSNTLLVDAPVHRMVDVEQIVAQLDRVDDGGTPPEIRTYRVVHADVQRLVTTLRSLAQDGSLLPDDGEQRRTITIDAEPVSRTLIVAGPAAVFPRIEGVLDELDAKSAQPATALRFFRLEHARADAIVPMLQQILLTRLRAEVPNAGASYEALLNVTADRKTNTLVISAPEAIMPVAAELISTLDDGTAGGAAPTIRLRPLLYADARDLSQSLGTALSRSFSLVTGAPLEVELIAAPGSNAVILVGREAELAEVEAMIAPLDVPSANDTVDAKQFTLTRADAAAVAPMLRNLLANTNNTRRRSGGRNAAVRVEADARTNTVLVSGPATTLALAARLIEQLDEVNADDAREIRTFRPHNADPARLAMTTQRVMSAASSSGVAPVATLIPEPASGTIVVVGRPAAVERAFTLLAEQDALTVTPPAIDLRVVSVEHGDATVIAGAVTPLLADRSRWPAELVAIARSGVPVGQPTVTADADGGRLLISAPTALVDVAERLVRELDRPRSDDDAVDVHVIALKQADASAVAEAVSQAMTARSARRGGATAPTIVAETSGNALVVTATTDDVRAITEMIEQLDAGTPLDQPQVRTIFLANARAEAIVPIVRDLLAGEDMPAWLRFEAKRRGMSFDETPTRIAADRRLNAVVVSGAPATLAMAETMVRQLDVDPAVGADTGRTVRVIRVANADVRELGTNLDALFSGEGADDAAPTIRVDATSGTLLVRATAEQFSVIERVVGEIDRAAITASREMRVVPIDPARVDADELARTIERLLHGAGGRGVEVMTLEELLQRRGDAGTGTPIDAASEPAEPAATGATGATGANWRGTLARLAIGATPPAAPSLLEFWRSRRPSASSSAAMDDAADVTIAVDAATNSLVIIGSSRAVERVVALAQQVQTRMPAAPGRVRYVALPPGTDPGRLARIVGQTLRQLVPAGGERGALLRRVAVVPDTTNNGLIIVANDVDFETVGDLVATLGSPPSAEEVLVKVYPLETITAERAEASVRRLLDRGDGFQAARMRSLAVRLLAGEREVEAVFDPRQISASADDQSNALVVMAPAEAMAFIDQYVELIDQAPVNVQATLKVYPMRHARAEELRNSLRSILRARTQARGGDRRDRGRTPALEIEADERTNTLIVTAAPEQLIEIDALLADLDRDLGEAVHPLRTIELRTAVPTEAAAMLERVVIGTNQARRAATAIVPDDRAGVLLVRADPAVSAEIDTVLAEIDRESARAFPVRTITLERADASAVADTVQRFYDDRARIASSGRGRREQSRTVSVIGDRASRTLLVAASDEDFTEIQTLVAGFDSPEATDAWTYRIFRLEHAQADEIADTVQSLFDDLTWNQGPWVFTNNRWSPPGAGGNRGTLAIRADPRLNALIATGEGDKFDVVQELVTMLDAPPAVGAARIVRVYQVRNVDPDVVAGAIGELFVGRPRGWWEPPDPREVKVRVDRNTAAIVVAASAQQHEEIGTLVTTIDEQVAPAGQAFAVVPVEFAEAADVARTLDRFLRERGRRSGGQQGPVVAASPSARSIVVSGTDEDVALVRNLVSQLDAPDVSGDRAIEIVAVEQGDVTEIERIVREQFGRRGGQGVVVTSDERTQSLVLNAPRRQLDEAIALIKRLDTPRALDETVIRTFALESARADEAVRILRETLALDAVGASSGITVRLDAGSDPIEVKARIVADRRSNSLVVTATSESLPVIEALIKELETIPTATPVEYVTIVLDHAMADDVTFTLRRIGSWGDDATEPEFDYNRVENTLIVSATADQLEQIRRIVKELDVPSLRQRTTDFIPLAFAEAEKIQEALSMFYGPYAPDADTPGKRNARIVADPATNSLVITADEAEWANIRTLLSKLDSEEYDASLQLRVLPLTYADARSVAEAINEAFQGRIQRDRRAERPRERERGGNGEERREPEAPTVLVEAEEWVRVAAEVQTNSVIVSASRQNLRKIEQIVEQLDVADYAQLPAPRMIPVPNGDPEALADSLRELYTSDREEGRTALRIVGDADARAIVVRAEDEEFEQIRQLADTLQGAAAEEGVAVRVVRLESAPARRVAEALREAYEPEAERRRETLVIRAEPAGNSLVIAATAELFTALEATVRELDALAPAAGQGIFIIELEHVSPEAAKSLIETIGLDQAPGEDDVSRLVTEPVKVAVVPDRPAIIVIANPVDRETIVGFLRAIDQEPGLAEARMRVVPLRHADAAALATVLGQVFDPAQQQVQTPLAIAVQEQVRRLAVRRNGLDEPDVALDLTKPIRIVPVPGVNALTVSSVPENVEALVSLITMFDSLPITDAVTVQLFPLENISADAFRRIVRELFDQGQTLARIPGTERRGLPGGAVGRALVGDLAMSTDERTNTVVVAGSEDAVALVEVLRQRLDSNVEVGWVEPRIVPLRFADAIDLAALLDTILVEGRVDLPEATPLQRQVARLRLARVDGNGGKVIESDVFQPMSRLVIEPHAQLNALVLIGTPVNLEAVTELVGMLDVEAASPDATVRIYPVVNASADRLAEIMRDLFDKQAAAKAIRPEDRVIIEADARTNALIVTTSPRSFAVLENLLAALDNEMAPDLREVNRVSLEHASATRLAPLVQQLMDARLDRLRTVQPETADLGRATVIADPRTNSLIVAAGRESFAMVRAIAEELDQSTQGERSLMEVIPLTRGNVGRIAETIDAVMKRRYADLPVELRTAQIPLVLTDPSSNSLLVAASGEDLASIRSIIDRLDGAPIDPAVGLHVISLPPTSSAEVLAPRLQRLMRERQQSLGEASQALDTVTIDAEPDSNTLIVAATDENIEIVRDLVAVLVRAEAEAEAGRGMEVIPIRAGRASDVVELLNDLYVDRANREQGDNAVQVTADDRINAVLVNASPADVTAIRDLIAQLDGARPSSVVEIKYIPLESANAIETVSLIENVLSGRGIDRRRSRGGATVLKYLHDMADAEGETEMEVSASIRETITLTPDVRTNTIIASAPRESMAMIERMIRDLDTSNTGAKSIRIFKLENADASAMGEILSELFSLRQGRDLLVLRPREDGGGMIEGATPGDIIGGTELTAVPDERQQLAITVDSRTNSLLVSGTPKYLDLVEEVVAELDSLEANEREVFSYELRNAQALDVAQVISEFVREEQEKLIGTLSDDELGAASRLLEREVTIQGDAKSNSVLVSASPRYVSRVREMIESIDVDPPQVLIQVMLAEVTLSTTDDWGFDLRFDIPIGATNLVGGYGLGSALLSSGFGIPSADVPNLSIATSDFELIFRALQSQGRLAVLSNPSIMAANNEPARIQVGETIQIAEATSFTEAGTSNTSLREQETGIILEVTPSINPDGFVRMQVTPTISALSEETTQITESLNSPIITIRTAQTVVTVQDGQTIVIGGLISDRYERRERKVPFFGDIPFVGALFRSETEDSTKTELIIVLTPHVVDSPGDLSRIDALTESAIQRINLPDEIKNRLREGELGLGDGLFDADGNPISVDWGRSYWEGLEEDTGGDKESK